MRFGAYRARCAGARENATAPVCSSGLILRAPSLRRRPPMLTFLVLSESVPARLHQPSTSLCIWRSYTSDGADAKCCLSITTGFHTRSPHWWFLKHLRARLRKIPVKEVGRCPTPLNGCFAAVATMAQAGLRPFVDPESRRPPKCPLPVSAIGSSRPSPVFRRSTRKLPLGSGGLERKRRFDDGEVRTPDCAAGHTLGLTSRAARGAEPRCRPCYATSTPVHRSNADRSRCDFGQGRSREVE